MARTTRTKKNGVPGGAIAAGVLAAGAAAAAGYYFYGAKHAQQHRTKAAKFANKLKGDVIREAKRIKGLDQDVMHDIVDRVSGAYKKGKGVDARSLGDAARELKVHWKRVRDEAGTGRTKRAAPQRTPRKASRTKKK